MMEDAEMHAPIEVPKDPPTFGCPFKRPRLDDSDTLNELVSMIESEQNTIQVGDQLEENAMDEMDDEFDGESSRHP